MLVFVRDHDNIVKQLSFNNNNNNKIIIIKETTANQVIVL